MEMEKYLKFASRISFHPRLRHLQQAGRVGILLGCDEQPAAMWSGQVPKQSGENWTFLGQKAMSSTLVLPRRISTGLWKGSRKVFEELQCRKLIHRQYQNVKRRGDPDQPPQRNANNPLKILGAQAKKIIPVVTVFALPLQYQ